MTVRAESALATLTQAQAVHGPPAYFTPYWIQAGRSVALLAALHPRVAATGHGIPMRGPVLQQELRQLAAGFSRCAVPAQGRYVSQPALADVNGVVSLPPAPARRMGLWVSVALSLAAGAWWWQNRPHATNAT